MTKKEAVELLKRNHNGVFTPEMDDALNILIEAVERSLTQQEKNRVRTSELIAAGREALAKQKKNAS